MADERFIEELRDAVGRTGALLKRLNEEKEELQQQLEEARKALAAREQELKELEVRYETLKVAKSLTGITPDREEARNKINLIIRDIDRCIGLLNR